MKKLILFIPLFFLLGFYPLNMQEYMTAEKAGEKWGTTSFNFNEFKKGSSLVRASMASNLIKSKILVNKPLKDIRTLLGNYTGYYFSDLIPAYAIGDLNPNRTETWQIVLIPDSDSKVIKEVKIHKKCCYK
jgi:hypothetical protein